MCQVAISAFHLNCLHASTGADQSAFDYIPSIGNERLAKSIRCRNSQSTYNRVDETDKQESIFPFNLHTRLDSRENRRFSIREMIVLCNFVRSQRATLPGTERSLLALSLELISPTQKCCSPRTSEQEACV